MLTYLPEILRHTLLVRFFALFLLLTGGYSLPVSADEHAEAQPTAETAEPAEPEGPKELTAEDRKVFDDMLSSFGTITDEIEDLEARLEVQEKGLGKQVLATRLDRVWMNALAAALDYSEAVAAKLEEGYDIVPYDQQVGELLDQFPIAVQEAVERISDRVVLPDSSADAATQAAIDAQFFAAIDQVTLTHKELLRAIEIAERFGINANDERAFLRERIDDTARNFSVYLEIAQGEQLGLKSSVAIIPDDTELLAKLKVADARVRQVASALEANMPLMKALEIPNAQYKQQLLSVTGEITADVLDVDVVSGLLQSWTEAATVFVIEKGPQFVFQLFIFFLIIFIFVKLSRLVHHGVEAAMNRSGKHVSRLLRDMVLSISRNVVIGIGILIALSQVGISLGPLLTGLGIAGFIIGFALQDSLSNFASGMMILFYRPFDVGDTIQAAGARGKVSHMSLVNTTIRTFDNQSLIIPNNKIWQDVITNVTDQRERRVDMVFGITYDEDIDRVEKLLLEILHEEERVLDDPEPMVKVGSFSESSVDILCRPWVRTDDYWDVLWDINKKVKQAFDREGVVIPFPQRDVHVFHGSSPPPEKSGFETPDVPEGNEPASAQEDDQ